MSKRAMNEEPAYEDFPKYEEFTVYSEDTGEPSKWLKITKKNGQISYKVVRVDVGDSFEDDLPPVDLPLNDLSLEDLSDAPLQSRDELKEMFPDLFAEDATSSTSIASDQVNWRAITEMWNSRINPYDRNPTTDHQEGSL